MQNGTSAISHQAVNRATSTDAEIESLARETDTPVELVQQIYVSERAKLERTARIKTYVPVLIRRQVKAILREQRASL
jgi:hypothetical protein